MSRRATILILAFALVLAVSACLLTACGKDKDKPATTLSETERDSVISTSALPGAGAVKGVLSVADSARVRADRANAASRK